MIDDLRFHNRLDAPPMYQVAFWTNATHNLNRYIFYFDKSILIDDNPGVQGASPPTSAQGKEVMMSAAPGFHIWKGLDDNCFFEIFGFGFFVIP